MAVLMYLLALLGQAPAGSAQPMSDPGQQTDGGGIPTVPGPHQ